MIRGAAAWQHAPALFGMSGNAAQVSTPLKANTRPAPRCLKGEGVQCGAEQADTAGV